MGGACSPTQRSAKTSGLRQLFRAPVTPSSERGPQHPLGGPLGGQTGPDAQPGGAPEPGALPGRHTVEGSRHARASWGPRGQLPLGLIPLPSTNRACRQ